MKRNLPVASATLFLATSIGAPSLDPLSQSAGKGGQVEVQSPATVASLRGKLK